MIEYRKKCCLLIFEEEAHPTTFQKLVEEEGEITSKNLYHNNLRKTAQALEEIQITTIVWINGKEQIDGLWKNKSLELFVGNTKSEQISHAFNTAFEAGFRKVIMLKADCPLITPALLEEAFLALKIIEFSIGLNDRGGFYQLGMNQFEPEILHQADWTAPDIGKKIIRSIGNLKMALYKTKMLPIIDKPQ